MSAVARTCLVVDDSRVVRKVARRILEGNGYAVAEAENGNAALAACRLALPDCILLDWNMPAMGGLELLQVLRTEFGPERPKVVFCTTQNEVTSIRTALDNGAQEYLVKPFNESMLLSTLAGLGLA